MAGNVYFLKAAESNLIKIGKTNGDVLKRKREIQNMSPVHLYALGVLQNDNYHKLEKEFHELFAPYRSHGEWFEFSRAHRAALKKSFRKKGDVFDMQTFKNFWKREIAKNDWI